jgi:hypothetical protein
MTIAAMPYGCFFASPSSLTAWQQKILGTTEVKVERYTKYGGKCIKIAANMIRSAAIG